MSSGMAPTTLLNWLNRLNCRMMRSPCFACKKDRDLIERLYRPMDRPPTGIGGNADGKLTYQEDIMQRHRCFNWIRLAALVICGTGALLHLALAQDKDDWESLPDGSVGKITEFKGVNDTPIAAYLRKPEGDGPFPVVVMVHGGVASKKAA